MAAPGHLGGGDGALYHFGNGGYSWISAVKGINGIYLDFSVTGLSPNVTVHRAYGLQLRCLSHPLGVLLAVSTPNFPRLS